MMWIATPYCHSYQELNIAILYCKVLCDVLITVGMVYYLLSNRTQVRRYVRVRTSQKRHYSVYTGSLARTNNVLNLLAIYAVNCGTLNL